MKKVMNNNCFITFTGFVRLQVYASSCRLHLEINVASCHSKCAVYEVINCRTIVSVHLGTYTENVNI